MRLSHKIANVMAALVVMGTAGSASAFCLKNDSNKWIHIDRVSTADGKRLSYYGDVLPGKTECCDWRDATCNPALRKDEQYYFRIYGLPDKSGVSPGAWEFVLPAGGRIEVRDASDPKAPIAAFLFLE